MNNKINIEELVSRYLEGEMSDVERLSFNNQLANNAELQEEYQLQNDILEGIRNNRKAELKARLDNIKVPSGNIYQYLGVKVAALITITTMIGFGAYYTFVDQDKSEESSVVEIQQTNPQTEEIPVPVKPEPIEVIPDETEPEVNEKVVESEKPALEDMTKPESTKEKAEAPVPSPQIVKPNVVESLAEENIDHKGDSFEISNNAMSAINEAAESKVEVETYSDNKKDFHYKFYNKKLFLYGDFDKTPYEVIEFNSNYGKLYYLYYEGKFYELNSDEMKITPLVEITDTELLKELEKLRN